MEKTGWDYLAISTYQGDDPKYTDEIKVYTMGFLEGYLTFKRIWNHYQNCNAFFNYPDGKMPENTKEFLRENRKWIEAMHQNSSSSDPYWAHAWLVYRQYEGLIDAYNSVADSDKKLTVE